MTKPVSLPLRRHPIHRTASIDEARDLYARAALPIEIEKVDRRVPFEWHANFIALGPLGIWATWLRAGVRIRPKSEMGVYQLTVPLAGRGVHIEGNVACPLVPGYGAITSPSSRPDARLEPGYTAPHVVIPRATMEAAFASLVGREWQGQIRFEPGIRTTTAGATSVRLLGFLLGELDLGGGGLRAPIVADRLVEAFLLGLLSNQKHTHSHLLDARPRAAEDGYVRRSEEYMEARADSPVTLADLAALTSRSVRSIQTGFLALRGYSPMAFLRARRLELAHKRLLSGAFTSVTTAAIDSGFAHLGRFSVEYRARFGESPRDTLRRGAASAWAAEPILEEHREPREGGGEAPRYPPTSYSAGCPEASR